MFPSNYVTEISDTKSVSVSRSDSKTSTGSLKKDGDFINIGMSFKTIYIVNLK